MGLPTAVASGEDIFNDAWLAKSPYPTNMKLELGLVNLTGNALASCGMERPPRSMGVRYGISVVVSFSVSESRAPLRVSLVVWR